MTDKRLTVSYTLAHPTTDAEIVEALVEDLRTKATDLGLTPVGGLIFLAGDNEIIASPFGARFLDPDLTTVPPLPRAVCYFVTALPDSGAVEIGFAAYASEPTRQLAWRWSGIIRTANVLLFTTLLHYAAEVGIEVSFAYAGLAVMYRKDSQGVVQCERKWLFDPEDW
jgi:hypothetical protein